MSFAASSISRRHSTNGKSLSTGFSGGKTMRPIREYQRVGKSGRRTTSRIRSHDSFHSDSSHLDKTKGQIMFMDVARQCIDNEDCKASDSEIYPLCAHREALTQHLTSLNLDATELRKFGEERFVTELGPSLHADDATTTALKALYDLIDHQCHYQSGNALSLQRAVSSFGLGDEIKGVLDDLDKDVDRESALKYVKENLDGNDDAATVEEYVQEILDDRKRQNGWKTSSNRQRRESKVNLDFDGLSASLSVANREDLGTPDLEKAVHQEMEKGLEPFLKGQRETWREQCMSDECKDLEHCPCYQRIHAVLGIYHRFHDKVIALKRKDAEMETKQEMKAADDDDMERDIGLRIDGLFRTDEYDRDCIQDDYHHILSAHSLEMNRITFKLSDEFKCNHSKHCMKGIRGRRGQETYANEPMARGLLCRIHTHFLHSHIDHDQLMRQKTEESKDHNTGTELVHEPPSHTTYDGRDDRKWMKTVESLDPRIAKNEFPIYQNLVENAGVFRYQTARGGMRSDHKNARNLSNLRPKYKNMKEEALQNTYSPLTIDNWNSTLRKSIQFSKTWECKRIRTSRSGSYEDMLLGNKDVWEQGVSPDAKEITTLKLYTDWSALQHELKKCFFRPGNYYDVQDDLNHSSLEHKEQGMIRSDDRRSKPPASRRMPSILHGMPSDIDLEREQNQWELEHRLSEFYHWRGGLLIFIDKFSTILSASQRLFHGVSHKMILAPSATLSFSGPLSTSLSFYVARNFASEQGMILKISSMYPRLGMCRAFNASLMSEYPEEQEYLVGHIYTRIKQIHIKVPPEYIHIDSKLRLAFFTIHLFQRQIFSMDSNLVQYLNAFLFLQVSNCMPDANALELFAAVLKMKEDPLYRFLSEIFECKKTNKPLKALPPGVIKMTEEDKERKNHIFYILIKKFQHFCLYPNSRQIVKIDSISDELKPYFLDKVAQDAHVPDENEVEEMKENEESIIPAEERWIVSFDKLLVLFPNLKQIHFLNSYRLDDVVLNRLITRIERDDCTLEQIKFLYYDYEGSLSKSLFDPDSLDQQLVQKLESLRWKMSYPKNHDGFVVKIQRRK